jgi:hydrogenase-4 membrane subunit HyfE
VEPVFDPAAAALVVERLAVVLLGLAVASLLLRDLAAGVAALALQSLLLVAVGAVTAAASGDGHAWLAVGATFAVKVVAIPLVLRAALGRVHLKREADPVLPDRYVLLLGVAVVLVAYRAAGPLQSSGPSTGAAALPASVALMLIGLLMMVTRRKALSQVLGLVTLENGIYLAALVATGGLPLAVELAIAFDVLVGAIVLGIFTQRISQTFRTINTDRLSALRDAPVRRPGGAARRGTGRL